MLNYIVLGLLLPLLAWAFTTEEIEIFKLQNEVTSKYGAEMNFYKLLKLPKMQSSTSREITKNLRRLAKKYHPDKNRKYKQLYERLNLATQILADDTRRKTYDYYLKHGFPDYDFNKGGFFFRRVQPKTYLILMFIYLATSIIHYGVMVLQTKGNKNRINDFIFQCKEQDNTNGLGEKYMIFQRSADDPGQQICIKFGDVYVVETDGSKSLVTPDSIPNAKISDCMFFTLPFWVWKKTIGRFFDKSGGVKLGNKPAKKTSKKDN